MTDLNISSLKSVSETSKARMQKERQQANLPQYVRSQFVAHTKKSSESENIAEAYLSVLGGTATNIRPSTKFPKLSLVP
jgi:hypothetical protein